jgi:hypothetical protein
MHNGGNWLIEKHAALLIVAMKFVLGGAERASQNKFHSQIKQCQTRYLTSDQAQALVNRSTDLLDSAEWSNVGAGLAVLLGRRISEILLSRFSHKSAWSVTFSEMAKKQGTEGLTQADLEQLQVWQQLTMQQLEERMLRQAAREKEEEREQQQEKLQKRQEQKTKQNPPEQFKSPDLEL